MIPSTMLQKKTSGKYVLLRGIVEENYMSRFFSMTSPGKSNAEMCKLATGETVYEIIDFADTMAEAQMKLYGKVYTNRTD